MSKNITIAGTNFNDVPSIEIPLQTSGVATFYDVSDTTAEAADVATGKYFYTAAGVRTEGTSSGGVTPTGTINISANGTYDVTNYASAEVDVPPEYFTTSNGMVYVKNMVLPRLYGTNATYFYQSATNLETVVCNDTRALGGSSFRIQYTFDKCPNLKSVIFPYITGVQNSYIDRFLGQCTALQIAQFGSVGYPITQFANTSYAIKIFSQTTQSSLTITIYVEATTLADIPTAITAYQPWGATGATIVYRNSTTGEVISS